MTRAEAIAVLSEGLAPLGPFQEPTDPDTRQTAWAASAGEDAIDAMLDLLVHPPPPGAFPHSTKDRFEYEISHVLSLLAPRYPEALLRRAGPLLRHPLARATIIEVLGALGNSAGLDWLAPLVSVDDLSEEEAARLACAIGEIGGSTAAAMLQRLRARTPHNQTRVLDEIEIAMAALSAH
ncbi:MAG TPA: hypothetical protein VKR56_06865 [Candidatus Cybelea sp.]|nr:hypothetical protein [Candidatus Cybelea sp.]